MSFFDLVWSVLIGDNRTAKNGIGETVNVEFFGGVETVTGSKFVVQENQTRILVDCGMFQGLKRLRLMNWDTLGFDASKINAVILTHAHLDHCGALPILVKQGFKGPIYCTEPTLELAKIILLDSAKIQEEDAEYANKKGFSKHHPALALYTVQEAENVLPLMKAIPLHKEFVVGDLSFALYGSGHILGAASALVSGGNKSVYFSGDLGRYNDPLMFPPEAPPAADVIVMESTYGDRDHSLVSSKEFLRECILEVCKSRGVLLIPSFSVGRMQNLLHEIVELKRSGEVPAQIPVFANSPMGDEASTLYEKFHEFHRLGSGQFAEVLSEVHSVKTAEDSKNLNESPSRPMIVVAASGMLTGGRILHHVKSFGGDPRNILLLAGFQSAGTRGASLLEGARELKIHGRMHPINCKVVASDSFSAHADRNDLLIWLKSAKKVPKRVLLVHGEISAAESLRSKIQDEAGIETEIAKLGQSITV